jgi:hypothetical protein
MTTGPQTSLTFFLPDRRLLGWAMVLKRIVTALSVGSLLDNNKLLTVLLIGLREGLSAYTDYASANNPIQTTQQSAPIEKPEPIEPTTI